MVKDRAKIEIAAALAQPSPECRDVLRQILRGQAVERESDPAAAPAAAAENDQQAPRAQPHLTALAGGEAPRRTSPPERPHDRTDTSIQAIIGRLSDSIVTVDDGGRVRDANTAALQLFRCTETAMHDRPLEIFLPEYDPNASVDDPADEGSADGAAGTRLLRACRADGTRFTAEVAVNRARQAGQDCWILCIRDLTAQLRNEQELRDSEARYRALVETATEAIIVLDVDLDRFVDANDNACKLFKLSRAELLAVGPAAISPSKQNDGLPSFGPERGHIQRALDGGQPVFEWLHCDAEQREFPCEVRFVRLPASGRRLIRASVIDITARRRADTIAHGERRILELIAANAALDKTLQPIARCMEQLYPDVLVALMLVDEHSRSLELAAHGGLPEPLRQALQSLPLGLDGSFCGAAASLGRQVVVGDIGRDPSLGPLREAAGLAGVRAVCSTPIITGSARVHGTLAVYFKNARGPTTEELDLINRLTQIAGIALRRKQDENALRASETQFRALFDNVVDGVFQATLDGDWISANPALIRLLGCASLEELREVGKLSEFFVDRRERERLMAELDANGRVRNFEYQLRRRSGEVIVVLENSRAVHDEVERLSYYEGTITDITERKAAERALFNEKERAEVTLKSIGDAVVTTNAAGLVEYLNPVAEQLSGWERRHAEGQPIDQIIRLEDEETGEPIENPVLRCLREQRVIGLADNVVLLGCDGTRIPVQDSAAPIQDRAGQVIGAVMVFHDVSRERQLHRKLSYYASHDSLTGLINRREFEERVSACLRMAQQVPEDPHTLLYLDLDQFKVVNDTCGHAAGDLLLRRLSDVLQSHVRTNDALARLGGDEFALLLNNCDIAQASEIAECLREAIEGFRFEWRNHVMRVGVSIGLVRIDSSRDSVGSILSAADVACYVAKDSGRNRIHVYEEGDAAERHQEMQWVERINRAREEQRLELFYQPIVPIRSKSADPMQYELLLRIRDEQGVLVSPTSFIPAAERYNLMPSLDRWVISEAIGSLAYRGRGAPYTLAINLSGTTLNDERFLDFLVQEIVAAQLPERALCFEITETAAIANLARAVHFMRSLKAQGCQFSLDDFGTGLSSLTYLKHLPVDFLKIDGQFIRNVLRDPADESMVEAIARMARALKIKTIAERVESRQVLHKLGDLGVQFAQGFYIAVPRSVATFPATQAGPATQWMESA